MTARRRALGNAAFLKEAERMAQPEQASLLADINWSADSAEYNFSSVLWNAYSYLAVSGRFLVSTHTKYIHVTPDSPLAPKTAKLVHRYQGRALHSVKGTERAELHTGPDYILYVNLGGKKEATVYIAATTQTVLNRVQASVNKVLDFEEKVATKLETEFWYQGGHEYERDRKELDRLAWEDIASNYPTNTYQLSRLINTKPDDIKGRLILLSGAPGSGKTTFMRCLASEWSPWCTLANVLDPDVLFRNTEALITVMRGSWSEEEADDDRWRLILLEDAGELIAEDAKNTKGHDFSRLLNAVDGMLAVGQKTLFAITTNEDVARLHPAVIRPGRCLARIDIPAMTASQAFRWLGEPLPHNRPYTLAELITLREGGEIPVVEPAETGAML
jgi:hypothetical protein